MADKKEMVELYIEPMRGNEDQCVVVGINGKLWLIPRGKTSMVPPEVKEEYERSKRAAQRQYKAAKELENG